MLFEQQQINNYLKQAKLLQRHQVTQHWDYVDTRRDWQGISRRGGNWGTKETSR